MLFCINTQKCVNILNSHWIGEQLSVSTWAKSYPTNYNTEVFTSGGVAKKYFKSDPISTWTY